MKISGFEKMSLVDYDSLVACTVFFGGCNFKCGFCHNSPLVTQHSALPEIPQEDILNYLSKRKGVIDGVCISGGEPTLNKELPQFIGKIKNLGYKVKLDTNGTNPQMVKDLFNDKLVDYFAMDIKQSPENYAKIIGYECFDMSKIRQTVSFFLSNDVDYEFRTTLVKEFHREQDIVKIGEWIKGAKKYFLQKFIDGENCIERGFSPIEKEDAENFVKILSKNINNVYLRGY